VLHELPALLPRHIHQYVGRKLGIFQNLLQSI
jgi:hypothetical protein